MSKPEPDTGPWRLNDTQQEGANGSRARYFYRRIQRQAQP